MHLMPRARARLHGEPGRTPDNCGPARLHRALSRPLRIAFGHDALNPGPVGHHPHVAIGARRVAGEADHTGQPGLASGESKGRTAAVSPAGAACRGGCRAEVLFGIEGDERSLEVLGARLAVYPGACQLVQLQVLVLVEPPTD